MHANANRSKLEEWMTLDKIYCPSPTCSAFIPARLMPDPQRDPDRKPRTQLQDLLSDVLSEVDRSTYARFFRGDVDIQSLPGYTAMIHRPVDLKTIRSKLLQHKYASMNDLTMDIDLIVSNAKLYNGTDHHPVTKAAECLRKVYLESFSNAFGHMICEMPPPRREESIFPCPRCHLALCVTCKAIEHRGKPCDLSKGDEELAMLATFGYKRCPNCKVGIKRMFGCSHMQCHCGAHFCWWCLKNVDGAGGCMGDCGGPDEEDMEEEDEESDEDSEMADAPIRSQGVHAAAAPGVLTVAQAVAQAEAQQRSTLRPQPATARTLDPTNLDGGGARRWADSGLDFGDEPEENGIVQVWSCRHSWQNFKAPENEFDHGDLDLMECNRCFTHVQQLPRRSNYRQHNLSQALECMACRLIVCPDCKDRYQKDQKDQEDQDLQAALYERAR